MVNRKKLRRKLPSLLIDGDTSDPVEWARYMKYRRRFTKFKPIRQQEIISDLENTLKRIEKAFLL